MRAYKPNWHAPMVAGIYCDLLEASRKGRYKVRHFELEVERNPDTAAIRLDAVIGLELDGRTATMLLEAETGPHVLRSLDNKCRACQRASRAYGDDFPVVLFATPDDEHMRRVRNATNAGPAGSATDRPPPAGG